MRIFIIEQKITLMAKQYYVFEADASGVKREPVAFAHQKRLALKEEIIFYGSEARRNLRFTVKARQVLDFGARYEVTDENGKVLGIIGKAFGASLLRSTWHVWQPSNENQPVIVARERSAFLGIFRRIWQILPYLNDLPFFIKYHFDFVRPVDSRVLATYNKTTTFRDHYRLQVEDELTAMIDWRVLVALGVMMDALQRR